ncbi:MAG: hypothetical protein AAF432_04140, partial [Planctomycetota bacterium]
FMIRRAVAYRMFLYPLAVLLVAGGLMLASQNQAQKKPLGSRLRLIEWVGQLDQAMNQGPTSQAWFELSRSVPMAVMDRLAPISEQALLNPGQGGIMVDVKEGDVTILDATATHLMMVYVNNEPRLILRLKVDEDGVVCLGYVAPELAG